MYSQTQSSQGDESFMKRVFIDGKAGTTGLRIYDRLAQRKDISVLSLSEADRKDETARRKMLNSCDIAFLCLPDEAAINAVSMVDNPETVIIDTSTAHRTAPGWTYGFPELSGDFENAIKNSRRIANPGCHASGFIALVYPLIEAGLIDKGSLLTCNSITGYSGGGKKMIAQYETDELSPLLSAPRQYGLTQNHKHLKEMKAICSLDNSPIFSPIVSNFYSGMAVTVPLFVSQLKSGASKNDIIGIYRAKYNDKIVRFTDLPDEDGMYSAMGLSGFDSMEISIFGNEERILLTARYDNLGKGASGAAIENMNIVLGVDKTIGLEL